MSVICPVRGEWDLTRRMLLSLDADQVDRVLILDNGSTDITPTAIRSWQRSDFRGIGSKLHQTRRPEGTIYSLWNHGFEWARRPRGGEWYVLVTNNDIVLPPGALGEMRRGLFWNVRAWVTYPDYDAPWSPDPVPSCPMQRTRGVLSSGGMFGACFMLAGHRIPWRPLITDLTYEHWYGDDHLAEEIEQHGGEQWRMLGLPVQHVNEATASKLDPGLLYGMKYRDRQRWLTRYERNA